MELASLIDTAQDRAGESLRAVQWIREEESELVYLRDDLDLSSVQRRGEVVHQRITSGEYADSSGPLDEIGPRLATVNLLEEAVLLYFPAGANYGVVVSMEPDIARDLHGFVRTCREHIDEAR